MLCYIVTIMFASQIAVADTITLMVGQGAQIKINMTRDNSFGFLFCVCHNSNFEECAMRTSCGFGISIKIDHGIYFILLDYSLYCYD